MVASRKHVSVLIDGGTENVALFSALMPETAESTMEFVVGGVKFIATRVGTAKKPEKALKLEVGKKYKRRDGPTMRIVGTSAGLGRWFVSENGSEYHEDGRWAAGIIPRSLDLIEEVPEPIKLEIGKRYLRRDGISVLIVKQLADTSGARILSEEFICELGTKYWLNGRFARFQETVLDIIAEDTRPHQTGSYAGARCPLNTEPQFQLGAVVTLKSGGPVMVVLRHERNGDYVCAYNEGCGLGTAAFPPAALTLASTTAQKDQ